MAAFDWEALLPVLFFILYGLAQFIGSKKKPQQQDTEDEPEVDPVERARQIREEIRRKIEERRRAMEGQESVSPAPAQGSYNPNLPDSQQQPPTPRSAPQAAPRPMAAPVPAAPPTISTLEPQMSPMSRLEAELEAQRRRLAEAKRQQEEAHQRALQMQEAALARRSVHGKKKRKPGMAAQTESAAVSLRADLLAGLRSPAGLRRAVIYREVLGPPLGLR